MKNLKNIFIILALIMALLIPITYSYAMDVMEKTDKEELEKKEEENSFFEVAEDEVSKNEKIEMQLNLNEIEYTKFTFQLQSSENLNKIEVSNDDTEDEDIKMNQTENEISIDIDKQSNSIETLTLYYEVPETAQVGSTLKFTAIITNNESEDEKQQKEVEIKIVEETQDTTETENKLEQGKQGSTEQVGAMGQNSEEVGSDMQSLQADNNISGGSSTQVASSSQTQGETVTYNGSDNNYLSELLITNYTLNREFSKDNSTYFITVENDVSSLEITATPEESTATVNIYGNDELSTGTNKVLITVTSENGNVRNYRIYVTKNS